MSINKYGTRVIQKLIETNKNNELLIAKLLEIVENQIEPILINQHSYHIVITIIASVKDNYLNSLYKHIKKNLLSTSLDKYGCSAIQRLIEISPKVRQLSIINKIIRNTMKLISNINGSYVICYILQINESQELNLKEILNKLKHEGNIRNLCKTKASAKVLDKCLFYASKVNDDGCLLKEFVDLFLNKNNYKDVLNDVYGLDCKFLYVYLSKTIYIYMKITCTFLSNNSLNKILK